MSTTMTTTAEATPGRRRDTAQYGLAALLAVIGAYVLYDASTLSAAFSDQPVQPSAFPFVIGGALLVLSGILALATARGDVPEAEEGEDVGSEPREAHVDDVVEVQPGHHRGRSVVDDDPVVVHDHRPGLEQVGPEEPGEERVAVGALHDRPDERS